MSPRISRRGAVADSWQTGAVLTFKSYADSGWGSGNGTDAFKQVTGVSVAVGDVIVVMAATEDTPTTINSVSDSVNTYTSRQNNTTSGNCAARCWTAVASTATTLTVQVNWSSNSSFVGFAVMVWGNAAYGTSAAETNTTEAPSLSITTTKANSIMWYIQADWNAVDGASRTWRTVNVSATDRAYFRDAAHYGIYVATWSDTGATGAKTPGLSAPSGQKTSSIAVEITT